MTETGHVALVAAEGKPWLNAYPPGVPATIDTGRLGTLADIFRTSVATYADRTAVESFGKQMTYAELGRTAEAIAAWLQAQGLKKGDRIALMMPNIMAYPAVLFGVLIGGYTVVNVNPLYTARELTHQLADSGARAIFVMENFARTVQETKQHVPLDHVVVVKPGDLLGLKGKIVNLVSRHVKKSVPDFDLPGAVAFASVVAGGRGGKMTPVAISPDDIAFLQYTGGTTGVAKGATLLHRNVVANAEQSAVWLNPIFEGQDKPRVCITALPLYHIYALTCCCLFMVKEGGCSLLIANPRDIPGFVKTLQTRPFSIMTGVNTLYNALCHAEGIEKVDFSGLVLCSAGGMAVQAAVAKRWREISGKPIVEGYGLSETAPVVTCNRYDLVEFSGTIGYPVPSTEVSIRLLDGSVAPQGEPGELCVRGPQVMAGYWQRPEETAKVMTEDGYFRTGDIAVLLPDGQVKIVDRMKDMVLVSGFNVYPNEVEDVLVTHPGVLEAAVIGVPDEHSGEAVAAYVVRKNPNDAALTEDALRHHAREQLTGYKVPRHIVFRDALPKTNVGKVLRRALRDEVMAEKGGRDSGG